MVTLVDTKFGLVCSLLLRRLGLPVVGKIVNTPVETRPIFTKRMSLNIKLPEYRIVFTLLYQHTIYIYISVGRVTFPLNHSVIQMTRRPM